MVVLGFRFVPGGEIEAETATQREKLAGESLKARLLKGLKENLFSRKSKMAHRVLKS